MSFKRRVYLKMKPLDEAKKLWEEMWVEKKMGGEWIDVEESCGRVTSKAVFANHSSPPYHCSAVDGVAVSAAATWGATEISPKKLEVGAEALFVETGGPIPDGFDSVIMIEKVHIIREGKQFVEIREAAVPWQNVRMLGEDIISKELIIPINHKIRPQDIGAMLAGGVTKVEVRQRPRVVIIPTGSELVEPGEKVKRGAVVEFNSRILGKMVEQWGATYRRGKVVRDNPAEIKEEVRRAAEDADIVLLIAGSSAGCEDYTPSVIEELGTLIIHGICIMPGKPTALGIVDGKPIIGIPGFPVSAIISAEEFVKPIISRMLGVQEEKRSTIKARLLQKVPSRAGVEEYLRVNVGYFGDRSFVASPLRKGSGVVTSMVKADGVVRIPRLKEGIKEGEEVEVELLKPLSEVKQNLVMIGSHDNTIDLLHDELKKKYPQVTLTSIHTGSLGGLMAIKRGEAHLSGIHLLDPKSGEYNLPFIKEILPNYEIVLITLVYREQGLILEKGNPKKIQDLSDLKREDITFINRQKGSGTRILLEHKLEQLGIDKEKIKGFHTELFTHMAVAAAVAYHSVDVGMGIKAAAAAFDLDFIPIAKERYDLAIPLEYMDDWRIKTLLDVIRSQTFKRRVESLGGYDTRETGKLVR